MRSPNGKGSARGMKDVAEPVLPRPNLGSFVIHTGPVKIESDNSFQAPHIVHRRCLLIRLMLAMFSGGVHCKHVDFDLIRFYTHNMRESIKCQPLQGVESHRQCQAALLWIRAPLRVCPPFPMSSPMSSWAHHPSLRPRECQKYLSQVVTKPGLRMPFFECECLSTGATRNKQGMRFSQGCAEHSKLNKPSWACVTVWLTLRRSIVVGRPCALRTSRLKQCLVDPGLEQVIQQNR